MRKPARFSISQTKAMIFISIVFILFYNFSFFQALVGTYTPNPENLFYTFTVAITSVLVMFVIFQIISNRYTDKIIFGLIFVISSFCAYFMDTYGVVIDVDMIRSIVQTEVSESMDLMSARLIAYVVVLGVIPTIILSKVQISYKSWGRELIDKLKTIVIALLIIVAIVVSFSRFYTSFLREHKSLRYYENPLEWINSSVKYINELTELDERDVRPLGIDAQIEHAPNRRRKIVVMVVGEALRSDHFGLNGYKRQTTPYLSKNKDIINFPNFYSCGTSTAHSVPCMFSILNRINYSHNGALEIENVIDVLSHTDKISILWIDNNSSPKGVMDRIGYKTCYSDTLIKPVKNKEKKVINLLDRIKIIPKHTQEYDTKSDQYKDTCLLEKAKVFTEEKTDKDILLVLHMKGSHGPQYFKRYPKDFARFTPECKTNQLASCTQEEIANAYDNTVLYTDYVLSQTIEFLKTLSSENDTALIYMADHGESLGEQNIYLHGIPYKLAPDAQKHPAAFLWFGKDFTGIETQEIRERSPNRYSHDNLFSTLLGIFEVKTKIYDKKMDMIRPSSH